MSANKSNFPHSQSLTFELVSEPGARNDVNDPVFGGLERLRRARNMTPAQRRKAQKDKDRSKATYDLPQEMIARITSMAEEHKVPASQLAALLMYKGLLMLDDGMFNLREHMRPTRSPRFDWVLILDPYNKK